MPTGPTRSGVSPFPRRRGPRSRRPAGRSRGRWPQMTSVRPNLAMDEELKRKILFTLLALVIYRIGAHIAAPGVNVTALAAFLRNSAAAGRVGLYGAIPR